MKSKKHNQMVEHKLVSFTAVIALGTLATLLIKLIRILLKWKCIQDKNYTILAVCCESEAVYSKKSTEKFGPGYPG